MKNKITDIYGLLQELAWQFGNSGLNGECCGDLSLVEFMALKKIYEKTDSSMPNMQCIGNALNFTKSGATRIIDRLEAKGYVRRETSPADGRVCCILVTAKGKNVLTGIMAKYTGYLEEILKDFEPQRVDAIQEVLKSLVNAINKKNQL